MGPEFLRTHAVPPEGSVDVSLLWRNKRNIIDAFGGSLYGSLKP